MMNFNEKIGIKYPIIQGAMAHIADGKFAAKVSNFGAMGMIASGSWDIDKIKAEIRICKANTQAPFGVNIMLMHPKVDDVVELCIDEKIKFITTGAGNPEKYIEELHRHQCIVYPIIPTLSLAKRMQDINADGIIAEGMEAGGHVGYMTTFTLLPQLKPHINIPIIAAGGIFSGETMLAAQALGACGVQIGTAFLATYECPIHENYKNKIINGKSSQVTLIGVQSGLPMRLFKNAMTRKYQKAEKSGASIEELEHFTIGALYKAVNQGDLQDGSIMAGLVTGSINQKQSIEELIQKIMTEYQYAKEAIL